MRQHGRATYGFVRTSGDPATLAPEVRRALANFDPDLPVEVKGTVARVEWTSPHSSVQTSV